MISTNSLLKKTKTPAQIKKFKKGLEKLTALNPVQINLENYVVFISTLYGFSSSLSWRDKYQFKAYGLLTASAANVRKLRIKDPSGDCFWDITSAIIWITERIKPGSVLKVNHSNYLTFLDKGKISTKVFYANK